jgi:hypothetical protein
MSNHVRELHYQCKFYDPSLRQTYLKEHRKFRDILNRTRKSSIENHINSSSNVIKSTWNVINLLTKASTQAIKPTSINFSGKNVNEPVEIAECFNTHFCNTNLILPTKNGEPNCIQNRALHSLFLYPTDQHEIIKIINSFENKFSAGLDGVPMPVLKVAAPFIATPLSDIINSSFTSGLFPTALKFSRVIPIYKKGPRDSAENYRPISILSVFSKLIEKLFIKRVNSYLSSNKLLHENQHGFRSGKSTSSASFELINGILHGLNDRLLTLGIFFDLTKAFDLIDHKILKYKLIAMGILGVPLDWVMSYLSDRKQVVCYSNGHQTIQSKPKKITCGVPQGSLLGPLLFLVFINDLPDYLSHCTTILYADDTSTIITANSPLNLTHLANETVHKMHLWCKNNNLIVNEGKTGFLHFLHTNSSNKIDLSALNIKAQHFNFTKFLGLTICDTLDWSYHIQAIVSKISVGIYMLRKLAQLVSHDTLKQVYYAKVHSYMAYGIMFWGSSTAARKAFSAQKRAIKTIYQVPIRTPGKPLFSDIKILTLPSLYILTCVCFVHSNRQKFPANNSYHTYSTRSNNNIHVNQYSSSLCLNGPYHSSSKMFNMLPDKIKNISLHANFKRRVKNFLLKKCYYSVTEFMEDSFVDI